MRDYIVFSVASNYYAIAIETLQRIVNIPRVTPLPDAHRDIDGMISYEGRVLKVLDLRRAIGAATYAEELSAAFSALKQGLKTWMEALSQAVIEGTPFEEEASEHGCALGQWLDALNIRDERIVDVYRQLRRAHGTLHTCGAAVLEMAGERPREAIGRLQQECSDRYVETLEAMERFEAYLPLLADATQKLLIYQEAQELIGLRVDGIEDIRSIDEGAVRYSGEAERSKEVMRIAGMVELGGTLANVIQSIRLPDGEVQ